MSEAPPGPPVSSAADRSTRPSIASAALALAIVPFVAGGALVVAVEVPPSASPTAGVLMHGLWTLGTATLTLGVVDLRHRSRALRDGLAGYLSVGILGLAVLHSLQWTTWAYVDVRAARTDQYQLVLETLVVPFGAGHLLAYCILLSTSASEPLVDAGTATCVGRKFTALTCALRQVRHL